MANITTICNGVERVWKSKREAIKFFNMGAFACDGSERDRYLNIVSHLEMGLNPATDQDIEFDFSSLFN